jgi:hypothetical protein
VLITEPNWVTLVREGRLDEIRPFDPKALAEFV